MSKFRLLSLDGSGLPIANTLQDEGHEVDVYIQKDDASKHVKSYKELFDGILDKVKMWYDDLDKDTIVIMDSVGQKVHHSQEEADEQGKLKHENLEAFLDLPNIADELRDAGQKVVSGGMVNDYLELDRECGQEAAEEAGFKIPPSTEITDYDEAIDIVKKTKKRYVLKPSGNGDSFAIYPSRDWVDLLTKLEHLKKEKVPVDKILLQEYVEGFQMSCEGWWSGENLYGFNSTFEHKAIGGKDIGALSGECGSVVFYLPDGEESKMTKMMRGLEPLLKKINYPVGPIDCNMLHNAEGSWFLEWTTRFGYPAAHIQLYACQDWGGIFEKLVNGQFDGFKDHLRKDKWFIGNRVWIPEWPFGRTLPDLVEDPTIFSHLKPEHMDHIALTDAKVKDDQLVTGGTDGELMCVSAGGDTIKDAKAAMMKIINDFIVYPMCYRYDVGDEIEVDSFKKWGFWLPD